MNEEHEARNDLWSFVDQMIDGRITPAEMARLQQELQGNADLQKEVFDYFQMHLNLHCDVRSNRVIETFFKIEQTQLNSHSEPQPAQAVAPVRSSTSSGLGGDVRTSGATRSMEFGGVALPLSPPQRTWLRPTGAVQWLVATIAFVVVGSIWMWRDRAPAEPQVEVAAKKEASSEIYATHLDSGTTRFTLPKVGYVIVDGPADFSLLSPMRARLSSGRIKMRVTEATGRGFVVETPYGEVTDLGTEFGIDIGDTGRTGVVVFEGKVDLRVADGKGETANFSRVERLVGGDGVTFDRGGRLDRMMSIVTGRNATFRPNHDSSPDDSEPVIAGISDNLRAADTKRFYEIVRGGFREDAQAFVDRAYEWNGIYESGLPSFLVGADYILPFNDDKGRHLKITLSIARPATVYILFDDRGTPPEWLTQAFTHTDSYVGMDEDQGPPEHHKPSMKVGQGAANSIDYVFSVWKQDITAPGKIVLGPREGKRDSRSMYGIVAVPLKRAPGNKRTTTDSQPK